MNRRSSSQQHDLINKMRWQKEQLAKDAIDKICGMSSQWCDWKRVVNNVINKISGMSSQRHDQKRVANNVISGESGQQRDQWREWPTTWSVERVANNVISGESGQQRDQWREWPKTWRNSDLYKKKFFELVEWREITVFDIHPFFWGF